MATIAASKKFAGILGMTGSGRSSPFATAPGCGSVLAMNGKYRAVPRRLATAYIINHLRTGTDPKETFTERSMAVILNLSA
jgi:hypothetical protein